MRPRGSQSGGGSGHLPGPPQPWLGATALPPPRAASRSSVWARQHRSLCGRQHSPWEPGRERGRRTHVHSDTRSPQTRTQLPLRPHTPRTARPAGCGPEAELPGAASAMPRGVQSLLHPLLLPRVPSVPRSTQDPLRRAALRAATPRLSEPPDRSLVFGPVACAQASAGASVAAAQARLQIGRAHV